MIVENLNITLTDENCGYYIFYPGDPIKLLVTFNHEELPFPEEVDESVLTGIFKGGFIGLDDNYHLYVFGQYDHKKEPDLYMINIKDIKDWGLG